MTKEYVVFTTAYVIDVDTSVPSEEGAHSPSGQPGLLSSSSSTSTSNNITLDRHVSRKCPASRVNVITYCQRK
jgi:hypothetical protein